MYNFHFTLVLLAAMCFAPPAFADSHPLAAKTIEIQHAWARPSAMSTGAAYAQIRNAGKTEDTLTSVESSKADKVEIHEMKMDGTIMRMRKLDHMSLPAGGSISLAPGGAHIMLIGLKAPLKAGESVPMTLVFEKAGRIELSVPVQTSAMPSTGMDMDKMH